MGGKKKRKGGSKRDTDRESELASNHFKTTCSHHKRPKTPLDQVVSDLVTASSADRRCDMSCGLAPLGVTPTEKPPTICWL